MRITDFDGTGSLVAIVGDGTTGGGADGSSALSTGFNGPRGVWTVPTGGFLLLLHDGAQLWHVDAANIAHLLVSGFGGNEFVLAGDGQYFHAPAASRIGEGRRVPVDHAGRIPICERDDGLLRRIQLQRLTP